MLLETYKFTEITLRRLQFKNRERLNQRNSLSTFLTFRRTLNVVGIANSIQLDISAVLRNGIILNVVVS